jgi:hypothetical protein
MSRFLNQLLCLFVFPALVIAQPTVAPYKKVDSLILAYSEQRQPKLDSLVRFVNHSFSSDTDKVRAYYRWIAENIDYDVDLMLAMSDGDEIRHMSQHPDTVFERRIAVCEGYARLMKEFCEASAIACEIIPGYSKTSEDDKVMDLYHAWNAVKINDTWQLVDVTWANNYMADGEYSKSFNGKYFLDTPETFVKDHLPLDPMWQLSHKPLTKNGFFENSEERIFDFNYTDSITQYLTADAKERHYLDIKHYHGYDPGNMRFSKALDVIHNNTAAHFLLDATSNYLKYVDFFSNEFSEETAYNDCKKASALLSESRVNLTRTINYLRDKTAITEEFTKNFDEIRNTARANLEMVNRNLEILGRYQKRLAVAAARKQ